MQSLTIIKNNPATRCEICHQAEFLKPGRDVCDNCLSVHRTIELRRKNELALQVDELVNQSLAEHKIAKRINEIKKQKMNF